MKQITKITLSGFAGSGKSTIGKELQEQLSYKYISVGDFSRKLAKEEYGITINEFQEKCKNDPTLDYEIDRKFQEQCNAKNNIVVDYRLGFKFVKNAFHVLLKVSEETATARINAAHRINEKIDASAIKTRNEAMQSRFKAKYKVDFMCETHYDLVIDTDELTVETIANSIIKAFKKNNQTQKK